MGVFTFAPMSKPSATPTRTLVFRSFLRAVRRDQHFVQGFPYAYFWPQIRGHLLQYCPICFPLLGVGHILLCQKYILLGFRSLRRYYLRLLGLSLGWYGGFRLRYPRNIFSVLGSGREYAAYWIIESSTGKTGRYSEARGAEGGVSDRSRGSNDAPGEHCGLAEGWDNCGVSFTLGLRYIYPKDQWYEAIAV